MAKKNIEERFISRRQFLKGVGTCVVIPPLLSLMPKAMAQALTSEKRKRLILMGTSWGLHKSHVCPSSAGNLTTVNQVNGVSVPSFRYAPLNTLGTNISYFADHFRDLHSEMNIINGLDQANYANGSHAMGFFAGSDSLDVTDLGRRLRSGRSIDYAILDSQAFKASFKGSLPVLRNTNYDSMFFYDRLKDSQGNFKSGYENSIPAWAYVKDQDIFQALFGNIPSTPAPSDPELSRKTLIIDQVKDDLDTLTAHPRLSSLDKFTLKEFAEEIFQIESKLTTTAPTCSINPGSYSFKLKNKQAVSTNLNDYWKNVASMIHLAFKCDLTRIYCVNLYDTNLHHQADDDGSASVMNGSSYKREFLRVMADHLIGPMKNTADPFSLDGESMLDNSLAVFHSDHEGRAVHSGASVPVLTFGKLGGDISTGNYLDYRNKALESRYRPYEQRGYPSKMLMISILQSMGLSKAEILREGNGSFGEWDAFLNNYADLKPTDAYSSFFHNGAHDSPLPFFTKDWKKL